jgi:hypothetical protein
MILHFAFAAMLASTPEQAQMRMIPAFFTGQRLYDICVGPNEPQCWMYVAGVVDAVFEAETNASDRTLCRSNITNRDAAERVTRYLQENEAVRPKAAAIAVKRALQPGLGCSDEG